MSGGERTATATARDVLVALAPGLVVGIGALAARAAGSTYLTSALQVAAVWVAVVGVLVGIPRTRRLLPGVAPLLVAVAVGAAFSYRSAVVPAALGVGFTGLLAAGVDVAGPLDRAFEAIGRGIRAGVGAIAFAILVLPAWLVTTLRRRDVLHHEAGGGWVATGAPAAATRLGSSLPQDAGSRTLAGKLTWAVGCVTVLLAANYGIGWGWDQAYPTDEATPVAADEPSMTGDVPRDPRNDSPAMASSPWRERYFEDVQRTPSSYWPFTENRPVDFASPYVNIRDWARASYEPEGDGDEMPVAWMFGGSTTWGEGQRDEYTIASWLARISEEEGIPLRVVNYGQRGWTHFQEMVLYEQQVAEGPVPDLSVFYDGANEITAQSLLTEAVPTHVYAYTYAKRLTGATISTQLLQPPAEPDLLSTMAEAYGEHSAINKVVQWLRGDPAGAAPAQEADPAPEGETPGIDTEQSTNDNGFVYDYELTEADGVAAGEVYERGKQFTMGLNQRYGVDGFLFWQPVQYAGPPQQRAVEQLTDPTVDLTAVLEDHPEVYLDGAHTNEEGARLVAEAIWEQIRPTVAAWYEENG